MAFIAVFVFELLSRRFLFTNIKDKNSWVNYCKIINSQNTKFSAYFWNTLAIIYQWFFNLHGCTFKLTRISKILSHLTSDVKLSHYFLLIKVLNRDVFLTLKAPENNFKASPTLWMQENLYGWGISLQTVLFFLFKCFEVWITTWMDTTTNIFLWTLRFTVFCFVVK